MRVPLSPELDGWLPPLAPSATPNPAEGPPHAVPEHTEALATADQAAAMAADNQAVAVAADEQAFAAMAATPVVNMGPPVGPRGVKRSREDAMQVLTAGIV